MSGSASFGTRYFRFDNHETSNGYTVVYLMYEEKKQAKVLFSQSFALILKMFLY